MYALGVDIGGTKIAGGVVDDKGQIVAQLRRPTDPDDAASIDATIAEVTSELAGSYEFSAVGLAAAGFCSPDRGTVLFSPNIPAWENYPLAERVHELVTKTTGTDLKVVVENDANAAGWAEFRFGAGRDVSDMLMLTVGTGLGGAIIVGGELVRGNFGVGAEVGHLRVVPGGRFCGCGLAGCWEQYASGSALVANARASMVAFPERATALTEMCGGKPKKLTGPDITAAAFAGDALAIDLIADLGRWLGEGAASVANLLDPAMITIGGGVCAAGDLLLIPTRSGFDSSLSARSHRPRADIHLAALGNEAGIVGAADLARR